MEKSKFTQRDAEKSRQRLPTRNEVERGNSGGNFLNTMDHKTRKSKDLEHPSTKSYAVERKEVMKESENVGRSLKEEKKQAFKLFSRMKKEEARKEKQKEREERMLKKIVGPKGESISLIDRDTFQKLSSPSSTSAISSQINESLYTNSSVFPELRQGLESKSRKSSARFGSPNLNNNTSVPDAIKIEVKDRPDVAVRTKSRKKKDPVVFDILKAIEICKVEKQYKKSDTGTDVKNSKRNVSKIAGNILDSSNPLRHRGKKREVPKKRNMTRLKKAVLLERERRRMQKDTTSKKVDTCQSKADVQRKGSVVQTKMNPLDGVLCDSTTSAIIQEFVAPSVGTADVNSMVREKLHSKRFREYCNHSKRQELLEAVTSMMQDIIRFQDRTHINQPIKAESHRRYVVGLRQTQNLLSVQKVKIIILASDIEKVPSAGGLDDIVTSITDHAEKQNVPIIFSFQRRQLGKLTYRKVPVSCIGILNYQGTEADFQKMMAALEDAKKDYQEKFDNEKSRIMNELGLAEIKLEKLESEEQPFEPEPDITYPLLKKLTEAIAEFSLKSSLK